MEPAPGSGPAPNCEPAQGALPGLRLTPIATGLLRPTYVTAAPGDDTRLYVLERGGTIRIVRDGQLLAAPFLDLSARVADSGERGLLGLAFHPRYEENGRLFVQYASSLGLGDDPSEASIVLSELRRSAGDREQVDAESEARLMVVQQPSDIHIGGMLAFGPRDGLLYISRGDGGSGDGQDLSSWLGKMLRIDVDTTTGALPYGIPPGNMTGADVLPEILAQGLRNPWRFTFDPCTAEVYIGDVGESSFEEVNLQAANAAGANYGWSTMEGSSCFEADAGCDRTGLTLPVLEYEHSDFGCAIISGYVYRGHAIPALRGSYLYADYCLGKLGSFRLQNGQAVSRRELTDDLNPDAVVPVTSFGVDNAGEIYLLAGRSLYRIEPE